MYPIDLKGTGYSWLQVYAYLLSHLVSHNWVCTSFAEQLILLTYHNSLRLVFSPLGFFMPLTYYKEPITQRKDITLLVEAAWNEFDDQLIHDERATGEME